MKPIRENKPESLVVGGGENGQPEYHPLEIIRGVEGALWSAWRPSWRDVWDMVRGYPIRIGIISQRQPPIMVMVMQ